MSVSPAPLAPTNWNDSQLSGQQAGAVTAFYLATWSSQGAQKVQAMAAEEQRVKIEARWRAVMDVFQNMQVVMSSAYVLDTLQNLIKVPSQVEGAAVVEDSDGNKHSPIERMANAILILQKVYLFDWKNSGCCGLPVRDRPEVEALFGSTGALSRFLEAFSCYLYGWKDYRRGVCCAFEAEIEAPEDEQKSDEETLLTERQTFLFLFAIEAAYKVLMEPNQSSAKDLDENLQSWPSAGRCTIMDFHGHIDRQNFLLDTWEDVRLTFDGYVVDKYYDALYTQLIARDGDGYDPSDKFDQYDPKTISAAVFRNRGEYLYGYCGDVASLFCL